MNSNINLELLLNRDIIDYDFRKYVNPEDELAYLFEKWIPYYNMKYRICNQIKPKTILEIGVRYGYSAITFLSASPKAKYVGIDNDSDTFGGKEGSISWAKKITEGYNASFILADTQHMKQFPGDDYYELIHIDGQQDGDGTYHDLELALQKGSWVLVDGYHWSKENMLSSTFFIEKYKKFIEYAIIIPGYAGELLIKVKANYKKTKNEYKDILKTYDEEYYTEDCGGYNTFLSTNGKTLDFRLKQMLDLINPQKGDIILDVGCGRGELSFAMAQCGAKVLGIDYSDASIKLAKKTYGGVNREFLEYKKLDVTELEDSIKFNKIVLTDVYEHIEPAVMKSILENISYCLDDQGIVFIHTAPNRDYYELVYNESRQKAQNIGLYLPENPRTVYEDQMHINEQNPETLIKTLEDVFTNVKVWCNGINGIVENKLIENDPNYNEIFAICSNAELLNEYINLLYYGPLNKDEINVQITLHEHKSTFEDIIFINVENNSQYILASKQPNPINISYHVTDIRGTVVVFDGLRTEIQIPIQTGEKRKIPVSISKHGLPKGKYIYKFCLVQEKQFWLEDFSVSVMIEI